MSFTVENIGSSAGTEIPQVYLHFPVQVGEPPSILRGFTDIYLQPGEVQSVTVTFSRYILSIWDVASQFWMHSTGLYSLCRCKQLRLQAEQHESPLVSLL